MDVLGKVPVESADDFLEGRVSRTFRSHTFIMAFFGNRLCIGSEICQLYRGLFLQDGGKEFQRILERLKSHPKVPCVLPPQHGLLHFLVPEEQERSC